MNNNNKNMPAVKKVTKKVAPVSEPVVPEVVVSEVPVSVETTDLVVEEPEPVVSVESQIKDLMAVVDAQSTTLKLLKTSLKTLLVSYHKEVKENKNKKKRVKKSDKPHTPHGFTKPVPISADLAEFLGLEKDALIARPQVTSAISKYVKAHNLADPSNGSIFKVDKVLGKLLGKPRFIVKKKAELGNIFAYTNLQSYLAPHFFKAEKTVEA
jgi:chromatin remodeling complex protein RSC6